MLIGMEARRRAKFRDRCLLRTRISALTSEQNLTRAHLTRCGTRDSGRIGEEFAEQFRHVACVNPLFPKGEEEKKIMLRKAQIDKRERNGSSEKEGKEGGNKKKDGEVRRSERRRVSDDHYCQLFSKLTDFIRSPSRFDFVIIPGGEVTRNCVFAAAATTAGRCLPPPSS